MERERICVVNNDENIRAMSKAKVEDIQSKLDEFKKDGDTSILDEIIYMLIYIKRLEEFEA